MLVLPQSALDDSATDCPSAAIVQAAIKMTAALSKTIETARLPSNSPVEQAFKSVGIIFSAATFVLTLKAGENALILSNRQASTPVRLASARGNSCSWIEARP